MRAVNDRCRVGCGIRIGRRCRAVARLREGAWNGVSFPINPCIDIPGIVIGVEYRASMGAGVSGGAEKAVAVSYNVIARVLPPLFRVGAEAEQIAVDCRSGARGRR